MRIVTADIAEMVRLGFAPDIIAGAPTGSQLEEASAASDYIKTYASNPTSSLELRNLGEVVTVKLDKLLTPTNVPANLHIVATHHSRDWSGVKEAVKTGFTRVSEIVGSRPDDGVTRLLLGQMLRSIDPENISIEDAQLLEMFAHAASGPQVASFLIGSGSSNRGHAVRHRNVLDGMIQSRLEPNLTVVLRPEDQAPAEEVATLIQPQPFLTPGKKAKIGAMLQELVSA